MKRKLVTILIGCMTLGLFGCGSGLSDTTKQLTPQQSEDSEQNVDHTGNEDQQAEADTTEKKAEDDSTETTFGYRYRQFALNLLACRPIKPVPFASGYRPSHRSLSW